MTPQVVTTSCQASCFCDNNATILVEEQVWIKRPYPKNWQGDLDTRKFEPNEGEWSSTSLRLCPQHYELKRKTAKKLKVVRRLPEINTGYRQKRQQMGNPIL